MTRCLIYYYSAKTKDKILEECRHLLTSRDANEGFTWLLDGQECYFSARRNKEASGPGTPIKEGEYRGFPYFIDITCSAREDEDLVAPVAIILRHLWEMEIPAVAECSFEEELPYLGGWPNPEIQWPRTGLAND
ncbi:MAG TPA: hypothetical protein VG101_06605 [Puia sp.]|jgi:hypothetical protein|nr:hypothetical protein [Puia sp.]